MQMMLIICNKYVITFICGLVTLVVIHLNSNNFRSALMASNHYLGYYSPNPSIQSLFQFNCLKENQQNMVTCFTEIFGILQYKPLTPN